MAIIRKLSAMPYAQAKVRVYDDGTVVLQSYKTDVITITPSGWLVVNGLYSATTRRHIGAFMREYANATYQTAKLIYCDNYRYNIRTGEVVKL
jgi:hypothetical protein